MRAGLAFSAVGHVVLLLWGFVLFASPRPFVTIPPEAITVDIVAAAAMAQGSSEPQPRAETASAQRPPGTDPGQSADTGMPIRTASAAAQPPSSGQQPGPRTPVGPAGSRPAQPAPDPAPPASLLVYSPTVAPVEELPLPTGGVRNPAGGYDAPANAAAQLASNVIAALRAQLQKCWNPPAAILDAQKLRVVLRVAFRRDGALAGSPVLLEASASAHGPALLETARTALRQCQPYSALPPEKYQEWKLLDLSFSPRGMSGG